MSEHQGNVIAELTADHREVEEMFAQMKALPPGDPARRGVADRFTIELVRHSVAEETYLYPAVREHVPDGDAMADKELDDHRRVEQLLKALEIAKPEDAEFDTLVDQLINEVSAHVKDEEDRLFPELVEVFTQQQLFDLGDQVRQAKKTAPTRPHPSTPDDPPNKVLAVGTGLVDRARDFFTRRGKD